MYTSQFFKTKLGQASLASITAMFFVIALTTQFQPNSSVFSASSETAPVAGTSVELA